MGGVFNAIFKSLSKDERAEVEILMERVRLAYTHSTEDQREH
jgi:hypothetical protein